MACRREPCWEAGGAAQQGALLPCPDAAPQAGLRTIILIKRLLYPVVLARGIPAALRVNLPIGFWSVPQVGASVAASTSAELDVRSGRCWTTSPEDWDRREVPTRRVPPAPQAQSGGHVRVQSTGDGVGGDGQGPRELAVAAGNDHPLGTRVAARMSASTNTLPATLGESQPGQVA